MTKKGGASKGTKAGAKGSKGGMKKWADCEQSDCVPQ